MTILFILITILLFGALIAIHEFGHFIAAKTLGGAGGGVRHRYGP